MRADYYEESGPARIVLKVGERPMPEPGPGEVCVQVKVSGVNPSDVKTRRGSGKAPGFPLTIPHSDGAGIVDAVGTGALYQSEDRYQPVNVNCYGEGDQSAWHFDSSNAFTLTLMLQAAKAGGEFEIAPDRRSDKDPRLDDLSGVPRGDPPRVATVPREPRAMVIFRGCNSVYRVTPAIERDSDLWRSSSTRRSQGSKMMPRSARPFMEARRRLRGQANPADQ
jgi:hypothetical protein